MGAQGKILDSNQYVVLILKFNFVYSEKKIGQKANSLIGYLDLTIILH